jgi:uncharacterized protein YbcI
VVDQERGEKGLMTTVGAEQADRGRLLASISNAMVGIHREYYGRGATRARTTMQGDYVTCYLEDIYTTVEKTLIEAGHFDSVRQTRMTFQQAMEERFKSAIEELTGRKVLAFFSQVHVNPDMGVEVFVLEPADDHGEDAEVPQPLRRGSEDGDRPA